MYISSKSWLYINGEWEPCFPYHSFRICTKKIYPLVELYVHFLLPISKTFFCTECEKMLISRKLFLIISSLQPPDNNQKNTYNSSRYFPFQFFFSSVWHMRRESHFIHCTFMGLIWLSHTWQLFFFLAKFPIHFLHSHPQLNANKIIFPTRWWKKFLYTENVEKNCYVNKYHCIISRECFSEMPSHLVRGGWKKSHNSMYLRELCTTTLYCSLNIYLSFIQKTAFYSPPCAYTQYSLVVSSE
jgi:hypothetical protein